MKRAAVDLTVERALWRKGFVRVAGVDEAGRGPLAGPVIAAAVIFPKDCTIDGVNDSKQLSPERRELLYEEIQKQAVAVGVGTVEHDVIDRINILRATHLAMRSALHALSVRPDYAIIDGNSFSDATIPFLTIVGGDARSFTIAAASIVAKVMRDRLMQELDVRYPEYGFGKHKGYGTRMHLEAIRKFGLCEIHRKSFHPAIFQEEMFP